MIHTPYLLFLGDAPDSLSVKVARGICDWRPENAVGQMRMAGCQADLGLDDMTLAEAKAAGARTLVIGVANRGGVISDAWKPVLIEALEAGFDLAAGLHNRLADEPDLVAAAHRTGRALHDVRVPRADYPIANGRARSGKRCLAVGTDCSVGKMYTALAMDREMRERGMKSTFRATGQTGILVTGDGVPLDAVVADFMAGAIEQLTPDNDADHWDMIEGQGSLFHVSFSGVTMALVHGGQLDALILCHEPTRAHMRGLPGYALPTLAALRDMALPLARVANPACEVVGVSLNTQHMSEGEARGLCAKVEAEMSLPTTDPYRFGAAKLVDALAVMTYLGASPQSPRDIFGTVKEDTCV
ncbi:MAG: N-acetyltransferase DgcN [Maritimibacter sp.]